MNYSRGRPSAVGSNGTHGQGNEVIVDRLHGALASYRKERDDLHRRKELAVERLRLVKEERIFLESNVQDIQKKLVELTSAAQGKQSVTSDFNRLENDVKRLNKEVMLQLL